MSRACVSVFVPHAGCPFQCIFCDQKKIAGIAVMPEAKDIEKAAEIAAKSLDDKAGDCQLAFFGGSFTAIERTAMIGLLETGQRECQKWGFSGIRISTRPDKINKEIIEILKMYGVNTVELGVQSMDDGVLLKARRGHTAKDTVHAATLIQQSGIKLVLQMMTGLPGDTEETALATADKIAALSPEAVRIYPTLVIQGTKLEMLYQKGIYRPQTLDSAISLCAHLIVFFESRGIDVIKVGLHAQDTLQGSIVAGPFHSSFRELCQTKILTEKIANSALSGAKICRLCISPRDLSLLTGNKQAGLSQLKEMTGFLEISLQTDPNLQRGNFKIF